METAMETARPNVVINFLGFSVEDVDLDFQVFRDRVDQYVFISSATVYAKPHRRLPLTESSPLGNPFSEYAQRKQECEEWLSARWNHDGFPVTTVRPSHTYSRCWLPNPVSSAGYTLAHRLAAARPVWVPDEGRTPWTLTASTDFAAGLAGLTGNLTTIGETFHITSDEALTWREVYQETAAGLGVELPKIVEIPTEFLCTHFPELSPKLKGDKSNPARFDNTKVKRFVPGFHCHKPFREGIRESLDWFRANPEQQVSDPTVDRLFSAPIQAWEAEGVG